MGAAAHEENSYSFCPYDGSELTVPGPQDPARRPKCVQCGFVDYQNPRPCVAVFVERDGCLLLGRRAEPPAEGMWDIPGGFVEPGESFEQAVEREIHEETGLQVEGLRYIGSLPDTYGHRHVPTINTCFRATRCQGEPKPLDDLAELRWFSPTQLPREFAFPHQSEAIKLWLNNSRRQPID